jgi:hypothetical protein
MKNSPSMGVHFPAIQSFELREKTEKDPKLKE